MKEKRYFDGLDKRLKSARKKAGLTQCRLAKHCNIGRECICRAEAGKTTPHDYTLEQIAKILHTTVNYLKYGEEIIMEVDN